MEKNDLDIGSTWNLNFETLSYREKNSVFLGISDYDDFPLLQNYSMLSRSWEKCYIRFSMWILKLHIQTKQQWIAKLSIWINLRWQTFPPTFIASSVCRSSTVVSRWWGTAARRCSPTVLRPTGSCRTQASPVLIIICFQLEPWSRYVRSTFWSGFCLCHCWEGQQADGVTVSEKDLDWGYFALLELLGKGWKM